MQPSTPASHRKSDTFDTFNEIWDDEEEFSGSSVHLEESNSNYFLGLAVSKPNLSGRCPSIDLNEVLVSQRLHANQKFNFSPKHLPRKPSNLLKSEVAASQDDEDESEDVCLDLETQTQSSEDDSGLSMLVEDSKPDYSQVPIAGALFVATCLGTPVIALTGLKMGIFAAVGGGVMGFATGKMFAEHEEKQAIARGKLGEDSAGSAQAKKKKLMKRIHEWQRFEENCNMIKDFDEEKILRLSELQKEISQQSTPVTTRTIKSKVL